jgi:hypothetical protein
MSSTSSRATSCSPSPMGIGSSSGPPREGPHRRAAQDDGAHLAAMPGAARSTGTLGRGLGPACPPASPRTPPPRHPARRPRIKPHAQRDVAPPRPRPSHRVAETVSSRATWPPRCSGASRSSSRHERRALPCASRPRKVASVFT